MAKPKFDKQKCFRCKYHSLGSGGYTVYNDGRGLAVFCNYSATQDTCLKKSDDGTVYDQRGDDYYNCKLYSEGRVIKDEDEDYELE